MNLADENGTDVEIYRKTGHLDRLHIVSRTGAPEELLALLDAAGLERRSETTDGPVYTWHETPEGLSQQAQRQLVSREILPLLIAGYDVNIDPDELDVTAWAQAMQAHRADRGRSGTYQPAPPPATDPPRHRR
ncbi:MULTISPECIES: hypothetical protein [unclassified Streptomyces]|uniref:hypothetical protein n=1 Tax=unclassified Streptomyces TaxID=2593676 RepID=UPI00296621F5|nr:hypothetical protein [Streptomyces sp. SJL17-1]